MIRKFIITSIAIVSLGACKSVKQNETSTINSTNMVKEVLTKEQQAALTIEQVIQSLKEGNERFIKNSLTPRNHLVQVKKKRQRTIPRSHCAIVY